MDNLLALRSAIPVGRSRGGRGHRGPPPQSGHSRVAYPVQVPTPPAGAHPMNPRQVKVVMVGLLLGVMLAALDNTIVSVAMPTIVGELGGVDDMSWVVTAYLLTATASMPLYGRVSDLY